jgi:hypothetical protein
MRERMKTEQERHTQQRTSGLSNASWLFCIAAALLLSSCGFQLRGQAALPFETIHIIGSPLVVVQLTRAVRAGTTTQVVANEKEADATLQILAEARDRAILSLSASGRVRELQNPLPSFIPGVRQGKERPYSAERYPAQARSHVQ